VPVSCRSVACAICSSSESTIVEASEKMFGLDDEFIYSECGCCGTLHLETEIEDWGRYYPATNYYSMDEAQIAGTLAKTRSTRTKRAVAQTVLKVPLPDWVYGLDRRLAFGRWCRNLGINLKSRILDVGSGGGSLVRQLATVGFTNLVGIDPFIAGSVTYPDGLRLVKGELADLDELFDFVMFHHSLEHVPDPRQALEDAKKLIAPGGACLVRIPVADSWARYHYGREWVELDAPRHRWLMSRSAMRYLAGQADFELFDMWDDSDGFQLWGSEQYRRGMLFNPSKEEVFTKAELKDFARRGKALSAAGVGDRACFILRPL
jgi:SAM-dependent methyltransferase